MTSFAAAPVLRALRPSLSVSLSRHLAVWRQRRALERLDQAALNDIGLSHADAAREAARPIWDAPEAWRG